MNWPEALRILELSYPKSLEEVREAYSVQAKAWHPDRFEGDPKMQRIGTTKMKLINEAFKFIKENWDHWGVHYDVTESTQVQLNTGRRKIRSHELVTILEHGTTHTKKANLIVGARKVHEYLGDAVITVTLPDHRSREIKIKVGEIATVEFGKSTRFEICLLQVRQVFKSRRGFPFPLFYPAVDLSISKLQ
jgi:hypothetical protein